MKLNDILMEVPMNIPSFDDFVLDDHKHNAERYRLFVLFENKKLIHLHHGIEVYELTVGGEQVLAGLNHYSESVAYYCNYEVQNEKNVGKVCTQIMVWTDGQSTTKGLATHIFFMYLLKKFRIMQSDTMQTNEGALFWKRNVKIAFNNGLNVYVYNNASHNVIPVPDLASFNMMDSEGAIWGKEFHHGDIVILITSKQLKIGR